MLHPQLALRLSLVFRFVRTEVRFAYAPPSEGAFSMALRLFRNRRKRLIVPSLLHSVPHAVSLLPATILLRLRRMLYTSRRKPTSTMTSFILSRLQWQFSLTTIWVERSRPIGESRSAFPLETRLAPIAGAGNSADVQSACIPQGVVGFLHPKTW